MRIVYPDRPAQLRGMLPNRESQRAAGLFRAGSLGDGLPRRDLLVSPKRAMFLDGILVPVERLVAGATIVQERKLERVDYVHVELNSHDVLLAEGAPSESFVDDNSRGMFHNAHEHAALFPDHRRVPAVYCAPDLDGGTRARRRATAGAALRPGRADGGGDRGDARGHRGGKQQGKPTRRCILAMHEAVLDGVGKAPGSGVGDVLD